MMLPFWSGNPVTRHWERNLPICFGGKLVTAIIWVPVRVSGV